MPKIIEDSVCPDCGRVAMVMLHPFKNEVASEIHRVSSEFARVDEKIRSMPVNHIPPSKSLYWGFRKLVGEYVEVACKEAYRSLVCPSCTVMEGSHI